MTVIFVFFELDIFYLHLPITSATKLDLETIRAAKLATWAPREWPIIFILDGIRFAFNRRKFTKLARCSATVGTLFAGVG